MAIIYHVADADDWQLALRQGVYRISTRGRTLEQEGFIHASTGNQVARVANAFYRGAENLVVLAADTERIGPEIRYERAPGSDELFPHIYGPLNVDAVFDVLSLETDAAGSFVFDSASER
jgi:uncharacterized protein (DUF952 family)